MNRNLLQKVWIVLRIVRKWFIDRSSLPLDYRYMPLYWVIHKSFYQQLGVFPDLIECKAFNDKIQWLKLFDQQPEMVVCSDKLNLKKWVSEVVGEKYVVPVYQSADCFSELDLGRLPTSFVMKCNHDSGSVMVVRDKADCDWKRTAEFFERALNRSYGWENGEWSYQFVKRRVFAECYIAPESGVSPPDYKVYVSGGKARCVHIIGNRWRGTTEQMVDVNGRDLNLRIHPEFTADHGFVIPENWGEMISVAEALGSRFKYVRVDLFSVRNRVYVGEMTFWPMFGCYKGAGQVALGELLEFDRSSFAQPVCAGRGRRIR